MARRFGIGVHDPVTDTWGVEKWTDSRIKAWFYEQKIGWREIGRLLRGQAPRRTFIATFLPTKD